jgi:hypothetical protein
MIKIVNYVLGVTLFMIMCELLRVDWQLMLMIMRDSMVTWDLTQVIIRMPG